MTLQQTSLEAWNNIQHGMGQRQLQVYLALKEMKEATNAMLSQRLQLPINCITPRTLELRQIGLVIESYRDKCPVTGRSAIFWRCKNA